MRKSRDLRGTVWPFSAQLVAIAFNKLFVNFGHTLVNSESVGGQGLQHGFELLSWSHKVGISAGFFVVLAFTGSFPAALALQHTGHCRSVSEKETARNNRAPQVVNCGTP